MKNTLKLTLLLFVAVLNLSCNNKQSSKPAEAQSKISVIKPAEFKEKSINNTIVDVRTPDEYKQGHIKEAKNINFYDKTFLEQMSKFDKNEPVYIYCRSGRRSSSASKKLSEIGFKKIYDLQGGILNWERNKNAIEK